MGNGFVYLFRGPCRIVVRGGVFEVNGFVLEGGGEFVVPVGRSVFGVGRGDVMVESSCGFERVGSGVYERYVGVVGELEGFRRVLLFGPSDSGKSTLASFIVNMLGFSFLTVDVGQNEIFMPGYASLVEYIDGPFVPGAPGFDPVNCFVGSFSPVWDRERYLSCGISLARRTGRGLVVDTDGWVSVWDGVASKLALALGAGVDAIVVLGSVSRRVVEWLERRAGVEVIVVGSGLAGGSGKGFEERRLHRERLIASRLVGAREYSVSVDSTSVFGLPVFVGEPLDVVGKPGIVYGEDLWDGSRVLVVGKGQARRFRSVRGVRVLEVGWERGLLAHVWCRDSGLEEPGIVKSIDYRRRRLHLYTRCFPSGVEVGRGRVGSSVLSGLSLG